VISTSRALSAWLAALCIVLAMHGAAEAKVFAGQKQALEQAFPDADRLEKKTWILTDAQRDEIQRRARAKVETKVVVLYTAWKGDERLGFAHIDVHTVRTHAEALLVVLDSAGVVKSVRILAFHEPLDYLPTDRWYEQFAGRKGGEDLRPGHDVHSIVGATLSSEAATEAVRRVLGYYAVLLSVEP